MEASREAGILTVMLDLEDGDRRAEAERRAARPGLLPAPSVGEVPGRSVSRQVNFAISPSSTSASPKPPSASAPSPASSRAS